MNRWNLFFEQLLVDNRLAFLGLLFLIGFFLLFNLYLRSESKPMLAMGHALLVQMLWFTVLAAAPSLRTDLVIKELWPIDQWHAKVRSDTERETDVYLQEHFTPTEQAQFLPLLRKTLGNSSDGFVEFQPHPYLEKIRERTFQFAGMWAAWVVLWFSLNVSRSKKDALPPPPPNVDPEDQPARVQHLIALYPSVSLNGNKPVPYQYAFPNLHAAGMTFNMLEAQEVVGPGIDSPTYTAKTGTEIVFKKG